MDLPTIAIGPLQVSVILDIMLQVIMTKVSSAFGRNKKHFSSGQEKKKEKTE